MQLVKKFDFKKTEQILAAENKFITDLFTVCGIPDRDTADEENEEEGKPDEKPKFNFKVGEKSRAQTITELQERLQAITSNKKKLTYKEKLAKKNLKNRMKKKTKRDERNAAQKLVRAQKADESQNLKNEVKTEESQKNKIKPVFNSEDKLVYSKIEFGEVGQKKDKKKKKQEKDPKKILQNLEKQKENLKKLEESGEVEKVVEIKEKSAWKNALAKAEGQKVKDDPILLKKTVKKQEQKVKSSKKKWEKRMEGVQKAKEERQKKRSDNINKKKKEKKIHKLKKAAKRGKIIPGF